MPAKVGPNHAGARQGWILLGHVGAHSTGDEEEDPCDERGRIEMSQRRSREFAGGCGRTQT
jgi:hypothetical protein